MTVELEARIRTMLYGGKRRWRWVCRLIGHRIGDESPHYQGCGRCGSFRNSIDRVVNGTLCHIGWGPWR